MKYHEHLLAFLLPLSSYLASFRINHWPRGDVTLLPRTFCAGYSRHHFAAPPPDLRYLGLNNSFRRVSRSHQALAHSLELS